MTITASKAKFSTYSLHALGVACGLAAATWLAAAEAPTKLVTAGFSPFLISLGMVAGVFVARWTVPVALKGSGYVLQDLREKPHLIRLGDHCRDVVGGGQYPDGFRGSKCRAVHRLPVVEH